MELLISLVTFLINAFTVVIFIRVLLSFAAHFMRPPYPQWLVTVDSIVGQITEPVLAPVRRMLPSVAGLDFSPMVVIIVLIVIQRVLVSLA